MKVCMIVPDVMVKGGIASVVNGYRGYHFDEEYEISYVESYRDGSKWDKLFKAVKGYFQFWRLLHKNRPDLVHIHSSFGPSFYRKLPFIYMASFKKIPVINHIHGADFEVFYEKASCKKKKLIQKVYLKCDRLIALSDEWKQRLSKVVPETRITVIENYCIIPDLKNTVKTSQIVFLGEIGLRKGCFDLPAICELIYKTCSNAVLVIAGDGSREDVCRLKEELKAKNLMGMVRLPGWVRGNEKDKLLKESSIFLFPSYNEGMPMAVLEAMAYGMAIVTTNAGGIPKLIHDGENGYLCNPGDVKTIAERVCEFLKKPDKAKIFGEQARYDASSSYSLERHLDKLLRVYREVLASDQ